MARSRKLGWEATWFSLQTADGLAQVYKDGHSRWRASYFSCGANVSTDLGTFKTENEAKGACKRFIATDADGREVVP